MLCQLTHHSLGAAAVTTPDFSFLFDSNPGAPGEYFVLAVVVFAIVFVAGAAAVILRRQLGRDALRARIIRRFGWYALIVGTAGLLLSIARYSAVPGLSMRFLIVVVLAAVPALAAYMIVFMYVRYPRLAAALKADQLERRYSTHTRSTAPARRAKKRRRNR
jgi:lysylphosphatidylglycerol synthetase-like protein (DUF2156 family)